MPFIRISVAGTPLAARQVEDLQRRTTALMASVLGKRPEVTAVLVEQPAGAWVVGGLPADRAAHLDAKITLGTNSSQEKARFIADAMAMLRDVLGDGLSPCTYVVVDEVPGDAWGYGGLTQDHRREAAQAGTARPA